MDSNHDLLKLFEKLQTLNYSLRGQLIILKINIIYCDITDKRFCNSKSKREVNVWYWKLYKLYNTTKTNFIFDGKVRIN